LEQGNYELEQRYQNQQQHQISFGAQYAIGIMHVAIAVNGTNMRVYLDKVKVVGTDMFLASSKNKYFYVSTSTRLDNGALEIR